MPSLGAVDPVELATKAPLGLQSRSEALQALQALPGAALGALVGAVTGVLQGIGGAIKGRFDEIVQAIVDTPRNAQREAGATSR